MGTDFHPTARVIADSINPTGNRLTTLEVHLHRYMLPALNTHRAFSRNSASSRAIPAARTLRRIAEHPVVPTRWASEQPGMQAGDTVTDPEKARNAWLAARDAAAVHAEQLIQLGVHKSIVNRLLEPFASTQVIVTATDWDGFWHQRCSTLAQDDMRLTAEAMFDAYHASTPTPVNHDGWHTPYINADEHDTLTPVMRRRVSAARCARVSHLTHAGTRDPNADLGLYMRLICADPPHASPLEHVATPTHPDEPARGNFTGWHQLRHLVLGH
jgi:hypothetical protein